LVCGVGTDFFADCSESSIGTGDYNPKMQECQGRQIPRQTRKRATKWRKMSPFLPIRLLITRSSSPHYGPRSIRRATSAELEQLDFCGALPPVSFLCRLFSVLTRGQTRRNRQTLSGPQLRNPARKALHSNRQSRSFPRSQPAVWPK
jgi:hypothetical protein